MKGHRSVPTRNPSKSRVSGLASRVLYWQAHRSSGLPPPRASCGAFLFVALVSCGGRAPQPDIPSPPARIREGAPFEAKLRDDHPLVGRIWSRGQFIERDALEAELASARFVLLGEKHDAPDHHRLQRELIVAIVKRGGKPSVVFEMVDADAQSKLDGAKTADELAEATGWNKGGWEWPLYKPIVELALARSLPIVAGNYPRAKFMGVPTDSEDKKRLLADVPYPPGEQDRLDEELLASHCGMLKKDHLPKMVDIQRLRDGQMAERMLAQKTAVLIAGSGHARKDRGVPWVLSQKTGDKTFSLAFVEVEKGLDAPERYAEGFRARALPFDAVWFTPALNDDDPCAKMK